MTTLERIILHACSQRQTFMKTTPKKTLLTLIATLGITLQARAVNLVFDHIQFGSYVNGIFSVQVVDDPNYFSQMYGLVGTNGQFQPYATIDFGFSNSRNFASLGGNFSLSHIGSTVPDNTLVNVLCYFTLNERLEYSLTGDLFKEFGWNGLFPQNIDSISTVLGSLPFDGTPGTSTGALSIDAGHFSLPPLSGTLEPGQYFWNTYVQSLSGGQARSDLLLTFDRITGHGNHVPDAGSTLGLLAFALGGLCAFRKTVR